MIGILITSHPGHCKVGLDRCLKSVAGIGYATVLGFDDDSYDSDIPIPTGVHLMLTGRVQEELPKDWKMHQGEHLQIREGLKILRRWGLRYVFKLCGDMFLTVGDLWDLPTLLDQGDALTWEHPEGWLGTKAFFAKTGPMQKLSDQGERINFLIESTYSKAAEKIAFVYEPKSKDFWRGYVGGRF